MVFALLVVSIALHAPAEASEDGHNHGGAAKFEWAGIFETGDDVYKWTAQKKGGAYADPTMKLAALPSSTATSAALHTLEAEGKHAMEASCTDLPAGGTIVPALDTCYNLQFDLGQPETQFTVDASSVAAIAFFAQHFPTEFEDTAHYFKDPTGGDVEPLAQLPEASSTDPHAGHDHGGHAKFEWAGVFETGNNVYMWTAQKKGGTGGAYADPSMKLAALPSPTATSAALHTLEAEGKHAMEASCKDLPAGGTIVPALDTCYTLKFDQDMWQSLFKVNASSVSAIAFFAQHFPTEFEETAHYFKDYEGVDVEPVAQLPEPVEATATTMDADKPWGSTLLASLVVNLMTLSGVIFLVPALRKFATENADQVNCVVSGFAAGALISCAFFLLLFEATHLIATGWSEEVDILWRWGTAILGGFMLPGFVDNMCAMAMTNPNLQDKVKAPTCKVQDVSSNTSSTEASATTAGVEIITKARLIAGVIIGDFFHNFCDGIFMGAAFKGCGSSFGWGVSLSTVLHEIPQEISDFVILTGPNVGMGPIPALVYNFLSGLSVMLGAIIVLASEIDDSATGLLLAFGGGVYLEIAATECMPKTYAQGLSAATRIAGTFAFVLGAILIGLVLLDHEHCVPPLPPGVEAGSADDPHAGHHH